MTDIAHPQYKMSVPGLGVGGAIFLAKHNPVAVGADTFSTEMIPWEDKDTYFPVHFELMSKRGIYNLENMVTRELVNDEAWELMFVMVTTSKVTRRPQKLSKSYAE